MAKKNIYIGLIYPCKQIELRENGEGSEKRKGSVYIVNVFLHTL